MKNVNNNGKIMKYVIVANETKKLGDTSVT